MERRKKTKGTDGYIFQNVNTPLDPFADCPELNDSSEDFNSSIAENVRFNSLDSLMITNALNRCSLKHYGKTPDRPSFRSQSFSESKIANAYNNDLSVTPIMRRKYYSTRKSTATLHSPEGNLPTTRKSKRTSIPFDTSVDYSSVSSNKLASTGKSCSKTFSEKLESDRMVSNDPTPETSGINMSKNGKPGPSNATKVTEMYRGLIVGNNLLKQLWQLTKANPNFCSTGGKFVLHENNKNKIPMSSILRETPIYVEVRTGRENRSVGVKEELKKLGATVVDRFSKAVELVVFKDGLISTYKKATKYNIPLVSVLWIEECKIHRRKVPPHLHPARGLEKYESPNVIEKMRVLRNTKASSSRLKTHSASSAKSGDRVGDNDRQISNIVSDENDLQQDGLVKTLVSVAGINQSDLRDIIARPPTPEFDSDGDPIVTDSPLAVRLLRKFMSPISSSETEKQKNYSVPLSAGQTLCSITNDDQITSKPSDTKFTTHNLDLNISHTTCSSGIYVTASESLSSNSSIKSCVSKGAKHKLLPLCHFSGSQVFEINTPGSSSRKRKRCSEVEQNAENLDLSNPSKSVVQEHKTSRSYSLRRSSVNLNLIWKDMKICNNRSRNEKLLLPSLVCTSLNDVEQEIVASVVGKLGGFTIETKVCSTTSHLVTNSTRRTLNLLRGIARGCWIVRKEWVLLSLEANRWLDEEEFELTEFSAAVQKCRLERQAFGPAYKLNLLQNFGPIFVFQNTSPAKADLEELIRLCGGRLAKVAKAAEVLVGNHTNFLLTSGVSVSPMWILDCITKNEVLPLDVYKIS